MKKLKRAYKRIGHFLNSLVFKGKTLEECFTKIYEKNKWGKKSGFKYYSGYGSGNPEYIKDYLNVIKEYVEKNDIKSVVDLGCGDFQIGKKIIENNDILYHGVDIVAPLIEYNNKKYASDKINFYVLDVTKDKLPQGDLCLVRQVLQHLSNVEIANVLDNIKQYKHIIVTEHVPLDENLDKPNKDKTHGQHTRLTINSGVYLDYSPFNKKIEVIHSVTETESLYGGKIVTFELL